VGPGEGTQRGAASSVASLAQVLSAAPATADAVAVGVADGSFALSHSELAVAVDGLAHQLRRLGVGRGTVVAIVSDNRVEFAITFLALMAVDATAAPVNPTFGLAELAATVAALGAQAVIAPVPVQAQLVASGATALGAPLWTLRLNTQRHDASPAVIDAAAPLVPAVAAEPVASPGSGPDDVALLMLTSGSTGVPKRVPLSHRNVVASIDGIRATYRLGPTDATLLVMPVYHGHGLVAGLLSTLASGGAVYVPAHGRFSAGAFWPEMIAARATWYTAVPTIHQILLARAREEYPGERAPRLRFIRSCSAPLAATVLHQLEETFGAPVLEAYGMTETAHQAASNPLPADGPRKLGSVGKGTGVTIRIGGPRDGWRAPGAVGEVCVQGASVTPGYVENPAANAESFVDGWFRTGDLGALDADGYLCLKGRIKDLIDRGGEKISPERVDEVLLAHPAVVHAMSFGVPDAKYGEEINAAVVLAQAAAVSEADLQQYCARTLSAFEIPKRIHFVAELPTTAKGAGDRRRLAAMFAPA